jgi:membrane protease YdiL (CAAX protease family)
MSALAQRAAVRAPQDPVAAMIAAKPLFRDCPPDDLAALARLARWETHDETPDLDREVDESRELLIVWQGPEKRLVLPIDGVIELAESRAGLERTMIGLSRLLADRLHGVRNSAAETLAQALEQARTRVAMGKFILLLIVTYSIYTWVLGTAKQATELFGHSEFVTIPSVMAVVAVVFYYMRTAGYPPAFYGVTLKGARMHVVQAIVLTLPLMGLAVLLKMALIAWVPSMHAQPVIQVLAVPSSFNPWLFLAYAVFVPLQELIYRGGLQGALEHFFVGPNSRWAAIICSNIIFSAGHLYISPGLSITAFCAGLFWGWLYSRQRGLAGVSVSHVVLGFWAFEVVGLGVLQ